MSKSILGVAAVAALTGISALLSGWFLEDEYRSLTVVAPGQVVETDGVRLLIELERGAFREGGEVMVATQAEVPMKWYHFATGLGPGDRVRVSHRPDNLREFRLRRGLAAWEPSSLREFGTITLIIGAALGVIAVMAWSVGRRMCPPSSAAPIHSEPARE